MFKVFNRKKKQLDLLENPISPVITNELGGIGELTFSVPSTYKHLELEGYIQVENDHEYVIKEIVTHGTNRDVVCMLNIEEVLGMAWSKFISRDNTLMKCAELVLSGTRWRAIDNSSCNVKRNLYGTVTNSYNLLQMMCTVYNVEFIFDTYNKTVTFVDKVGKDAGVYFINDINLKQLNVDTHTHKYITRVIPIGKDGLTIESVNDGKNYLENKSYSDKNIYGIWQSDKHDDPSALKADAKRFLDEMAIPYETYEVVVDDLYALKGYDEFKYGLGDIVTIIDGDTETRIQQRIIQRTYNLLEPDKDTIHIANKDATFEDYYKRLQTIADMTQSVIGSDGTISGGSISDGTVSGDKLENDSITSDHIQSGSIESTHIKAEQILADHIMANQITTNHLVADSITSDHIQANSIDTKHLKANTITSDHIQSNTINSNHISANTITSGHIQSGAITAGSGIIADGAIGNAQISKIDAGKIEAGTIDTSKVTIQGANGHLRLKGNRMQVFQGVGNQAKERVSVGDVNGDGTIYGLRVRGADGQTILLDENGVKSEGITDGSITNDKINEDANIDGAKLNINSVVSKINEDGTEVIKGTKIEVDGTNLNAKLSTITNKQTEDSERITQAYSQITANENAINLKVDEQTYTADKKDMTSKLEKNTSDISVMKGQIALKVEQTDIENAKNEINNSVDTKISSAKSELKVTTDGISQKVGKLETTTTTLSGKVDTANTNATNAKNTANTANSNANQALTQLTTTNNRLSSVETNLNGITSRVSNVETTTTTLNGKVTNQETRLTQAEQKITDKAITSVVQESQLIKDINNKVSSNTSLIEQTANQISSKVSNEDFESYKTQTANEISSKITSKDVSSIIRQSSNDIQIGFNGINDRINVNPTSMDFRATNNNRDMSLYGGQVCIYNNTNDTFMSTVGNVLRADPSYKGVGFLASKHCNTFVIGQDANWNDIYENRSPNPLSRFFINFESINAQLDGVKGIHLRDITYTTGDLCGIGESRPSIHGFNSISATSTCFDHWRSLVDNSIVARFDGGTNKILLGKNLNGNGFILENFASVNTSKVYLDNVYAYNGNYGKLLFRTNGWDMFNGANWDWQGYNILNPTIIGGSVQTSYALASGYDVDVENDVDILIANEGISDIDENGNVSYDLNEMVKLLYSKVHDLEKEVDSLKQENNELKLLLNKGE